MNSMLIESDDRLFAWMLGRPAPAAPLRLAPGGIDQPHILEMLRRLTAELRVTCGGGSWMIVADNEFVGLCGFKRAPDADGAVVIGYGMAPRHCNRGRATSAVAAILRIEARNSNLHRVVAEISVADVASQRVLERNAFVRVGGRIDSEDGDLVLWWREVDGSVA